MVERELGETSDGDCPRCCSRQRSNSRGNELGLAAGVSMLLLVGARPRLCKKGREKRKKAAGVGAGALRDNSEQAESAAPAGLRASGTAWRPRRCAVAPVRALVRLLGAWSRSARGCTRPRP